MTLASCCYIWRPAISVSSSLLSSAALLPRGYMHLGPTAFIQLYEYVFFSRNATHSERRCCGSQHGTHQQLETRATAALAWVTFCSKMHEAFSVIALPISVALHYLYAVRQCSDRVIWLQKAAKDLPLVRSSLVSFAETCETRSQSGLTKAASNPHAVWGLGPCICALVPK